MAVRQDEVQLRIDFVTDEGKKMAAAIRQTNEYTTAIKNAQKAADDANKQLEKSNITEAKRAELLKKVADNEKIVADNLRKIAAEGKSVEGLDLGRVIPQQLVDRAKQLEQTLRRIPASAPEYAALRGELNTITAQLRSIRATPPAPGGGGFLGSITGAAGRLVPQLAAALGVWETLKSAVTGAGKKEQLAISFETFLGDAQKAKEVLGELKQFEAKTPFEAEQVNDAGRALLAFGFSTEELIPVLTRVGDVASGTGKDFNELALIYGKAKAQGLIQGEELNQLAEAGIPIYAELGKVLGVSESKIRKLGEEGKIQFSDLEKVFQNLTTEGGRFAGLMERQSQSQQGLYSTLKSSFDALLTNLGTALQPAIKDVLRGLIGITDFLTKTLTPVFDLVGKSINGWTLLFKDLGTVVASVWNYFSLERIQGIVSNFGIVGQALGGLIGQYRQSREEQAKIDKEYDARAKAENERDERQLSPAEREAIREKERIKAQEAADARAKAREEQEKKQRAAEARAKAAFDKAFAEVEAVQASAELAQEALFITGQIKELTYQQELGRIQEEGLRRRLEVFKTFGRENTVEAQKTANELLTIEQFRAQRLLDSLQRPETLGLPLEAYSEAEGDNTGPRLDVAKAGADASKSALRDKYAQALITEQEYQMRSLELKRAFIEEELAILRSSSTDQTKEIEKRENEKAKIEEKMAEQRAENERKLAEVKTRMSEAGAQAFSAGIELGIELLSKDENARRKHATAIKAFEIGNVAAQGVTEIQKIFAKNAALPGGTLLSIAESIPAGLRTAAAIVKITRQKFAGGGDTGPGIAPPDSTGHRPAGVVHANEYVVPQWMRRIPAVEATLGAWEGIRLRGYASGGLVTSNTTPTINLQSPAVTASAGAEVAMMRIQTAADTMLSAALAIPREVRGKWVYNDFTTVETTINQVQREAEI